MAYSSEARKACRIAALNIVWQQRQDHPGSRMGGAKPEEGNKPGTEGRAKQQFGGRWFLWGDERIHSFSSALYSVLLIPIFPVIFYVCFHFCHFIHLSNHSPIQILTHQEEAEKPPFLCHDDPWLNSADILGRGLVARLTSGKLYMKCSAFLLTIVYGLLPGKCLHSPLHSREVFLFQTMLGSCIPFVGSSLQPLQTAGNPSVLGETSQVTRKCNKKRLFVYKDQ